MSSSGSTISIAGGDLYCDGDRACSNATIYIENSNQIIYHCGHLSAQNSIFYPLESYTDFRFYGDSSGQNATIVAKSGDEIDIICYTNGCDGLNLLCGDLSNSDTGCNFDVDCTSALKSGVCSDGGLVLPDFMYNIPNLDDLMISTFSNSISACETNISSNSNNLVCSSSGECGNGTITNNDRGIVCCIGRGSCNNAINIIAIAQIIMKQMVLQ